MERLNDPHMRWHSSLLPMEGCPLGGVWHGTNHALSQRTSDRHYSTEANGWVRGWTRPLHPLPAGDGFCDLAALGAELSV